MYYLDYGYHLFGLIAFFFLWVGIGIRPIMPLKISFYNKIHPIDHVYVTFHFSCIWQRQNTSAYKFIPCSIPTGFRYRKVFGGWRNTLTLNRSLNMNGRPLIVYSSQDDSIEFVRTKVGPNTNFKIVLIRKRNSP